jgi:starch-binding outer membrane protein, SusD/RagB family
VLILVFDLNKTINFFNMKNNFLPKLLVTLMLFMAFFACKKKFLDVNPQGVLDEATLSSEKGVNRLLLAAYAMLDSHDGALNLGGEWGNSGSNFLYGSIGGGEANKGSDPGDQGANMTPVLRHDLQPPSTNGALNDRWRAIYEGVKRTNTTLRVLAKVPDVSDANMKNLSGQARALRAWYHFQARITFGKVPYINEQTDADLESGALKGVPNDADIFPQILEDAKYAYDNLPEEQDAVGRINKWVAGAIYGKILMFAKDYNTALTVLKNVVDNGKNPLGVKFALNANYDDNFNLDFDNSPESVLAFQASSNDNASARNGNWGDLLNTPSATGGGGAGFFTPTYYFVNSFKTNAAGLPVANPHNNQVMDPFQQPGYTRYAGNIDPRLDWTVGRDDVPFHDWGTYQSSWPRDRSAGPYAGKKIMIRQAQVGATHDASIWFVAGGTALNLNLIRFSDVILLLAEAEIEVGSLSNAFNLINRVRTRAQNTRKVAVPASSGTPFVSPYPSVFGSKEEARTAVRLERLLELGMEGHRYFDLVRWGISEQEMNNFYNYESSFPYQVLLKPKPTYESPEDDYYPIPQQQIDLSQGTLTP